jgi:hypothetical protein
MLFSLCMEMLANSNGILLFLQCAGSSHNQNKEQLKGIGTWEQAQQKNAQPPTIGF